ncbi:hypothetical protein [Caballeronia mineralivorans]|uniref:hypothetical protein n=1 Tax=Caballeronia mineralivorans TaxID=2010198 RepID=UPI0023EF8D12|nr:hypothetical protein [Caballeronia mineralivorans]
MLVANFAHDPAVTVQQPLFTEMFEPSFRCSGAGLAYLDIVNYNVRLRGNYDGTSGLSNCRAPPINWQARSLAALLR